MDLIDMDWQLLVSAETVSVGDCTEKHTFQYFLEASGNVHFACQLNVWRANKLKN